MSGRLASKCTTQSSSEIGSPVHDKLSKIVVMAFIFSSSFFSRKEKRLCLSSSLLAHVLFWSWFASFPNTVAGFPGSPTKYNSDGSTDSTIIAGAHSLLVKNFAYLSLTQQEAASVPSTMLYNPSFMRAIQLCIFQVGGQATQTKQTFNSTQQQLQQCSGKVLGPEPDENRLKRKQMRLTRNHSQQASKSQVKNDFNQSPKKPDAIYRFYNLIKVSMWIIKLCFVT